MSLEVRELRAGEAPLWRTLRLRALRESPDAYQITYELEARRSEDNWNERIDSRASDPLATSLVAELDGQPVGITACSFDENDPSVCHLFAMWVVPEARRSGIGRSLLGFALNWMKERRATWARLGVTEGNEAASRLYSSFGFADTGEREPLREGSPLRVVTLQRSVNEQSVVS